MALLCPFAKVVWNQVLAWEDFDTQLANTQLEPMHIDDWWDKAVHKVPKPMKRQFNRVVIHTIWNIWKERNRRIFNNTSEHQCRWSPELGRILCKEREPA